MIQKINAKFNNTIAYTNNENKQIPFYGKQKVVQDTFKKTAKSLSLDEAIETLYTKMQNPDKKFAEVNFDKQGLLFVDLDNMKLAMKKIKNGDKNQIVTFFTHKTDSKTGTTTSVIKMTSDNLDDAVKNLKSTEFIEKLEHITRKLNEVPEYIDIK